MSKIGIFIRQYRTEVLGLTAAEFVAQMTERGESLSESALIRIELGRKPQPLTIGKIKRAFPGIAEYLDGEK